MTDQTPPKEYDVVLMEELPPDYVSVNKDDPEQMRMWVDITSERTDWSTGELILIGQFIRISQSLREVQKELDSATVAEKWLYAQEESLTRRSVSIARALNLVRARERNHSISYQNLQNAADAVRGQGGDRKEDIERRKKALLKRG